MYRLSLSTITGLLARLRPSESERVGHEGASRPERGSLDQRSASATDGPRSMLDALPDAALLLDAQGMLIATNAAASEVFGQLHIGEHIGRTVRQPELVNAVKTVSASGSSSRLTDRGIAAA